VEKYAFAQIRREAVWGIVVLVDADEHEMMEKAVEEWSKENGNPMPIRVGQGRFIGGMNMVDSKRA
jgi:hypothetical protein